VKKEEDMNHVGSWAQFTIAKTESSLANSPASFAAETATSPNPPPPLVALLGVHGGGAVSGDRLDPTNRWTSTGLDILVDA
jgi:hypothetical protein